MVLSLMDPLDPHESHFTSKMKLYEEFFPLQGICLAIVLTAKPHLLFLEAV